jgi:hypothetical protein
MANHDTPTPAREPYTTPELRVYGSVAALTAAASMMGSQKDGGPNNIKS